MICDLTVQYIDNVANLFTVVFHVTSSFILWWNLLYPCHDFTFAYNTVFVIIILNCYFYPQILTQFLFFNFCFHKYNIQSVVLFKSILIQLEGENLNMHLLLNKIKD